MRQYRFVIASLACLCTSDVFCEKPNIFADISESAQENAVSFDGIRGAIGLVFQGVNYIASTARSTVNTDNSIKIFGLTIGMEYAKSFRQGFLIGVDISADINKRKRKDGDWNTLSRAYDSEMSMLLSNLKTGKLDAKAITPVMALKLGYLIKKFHSIAYLKAGAAKISGTYNYNYANNNFAKINVGQFIPFVGIGGEYKFNRKWGVALEACTSIKRSTTKHHNNIDLKIKLGRTDVRLMGTYSISDK